MALGVQSAGIVKDRVRHAQLCGAGVHALHKGLLAAAHQLRHSHSGVVGGGHADRLDHFVQRELLAGLQPDLTAAHVVGMLAHRHRRVHGQLSVMHRFKGKQQGHHLGDGRNGHLLVGVFFIQHRAGLLVDETGGAAGQFQRRRLCGKLYRPLRLHRRLHCRALPTQAAALCRAKGQRKQPEAHHPRAQKRQVFSLHSGPSLRNVSW